MTHYSSSFWSRAMTWKSDTGTKIEHCPIRYRKPVSTKFGTIVMVNKEFQIACQTLQKPVPVFCTDFWYIYIHTRLMYHTYIQCVPKIRLA